MDPAAADQQEGRVRARNMQHLAGKAARADVPPLGRNMNKRLQFRK